ncbi:helix-turn-helix domain-containing protein [Piscinibacter defluvii]|uniref:helix-turn-helix domain-containing protein n=1 Tax=Piscinibacter defluvii TaxID=1796922 RepID=UPI000FDF4981|nr:helix-turn-helix domain-containing protein [Piscinibacter defluvii]
MSEDRADAAAPADSAGALLRQARQAQGMHIAVLAAAIKVPQRKLEALEGDRYDELPDATFTRALAQTVCRTLKIDAAPVLALLPKAFTDSRLEHVAEGINAPFRDRGGPDTGGDWGIALSPAVWAALVVLVLAAGVYFMPSGLLGPSASSGAASAPVVSVLPASAVAPAAAPAPVPEAPAASAAAPAVAAVEPPASTAGETVHSAPLAANDSAASAPAVPPASGALLLRTSAESWIEVIDARGQTLLSRVLTPGEAVGLDGAMPLRLTIGNAAATTVSLRGQPVDLAPRTRDNVARLELR